MTTTILIVSGVLLGPPVILVVLAHFWADTPYGRIKPIFALVFKLAPLIKPGAAHGAIGATATKTREELAARRAEFSRLGAALSKPVAFGGTIEDRLLTEAPGPSVPVRMYRPDDAGPLPLLVYFHGGGFVVGDTDFTDGVCRILALRSPAVVVSVDYRLAPEHPYPAAVEDCTFAVQWCYENAASLGARSGALAVAGDSAGGNLSAVVAQRDARAGRNQIGLQALIYPCVDATRTDRPSHLAFREGYGLSVRDIEECLRSYVAPGTGLDHPDISPLHAEDLSRLAPAHVITAGFDILRDEGIAYVDALRKAGVSVTHEHDPAMPHGFITMTRLCKEAETHLATIADQIRAMAAQ